MRWPHSTRAAADNVSGQVFWLLNKRNVLPSHPADSGARTFSSVTAAGPRRTCTVFSIKLHVEHPAEE